MLCLVGGGSTGYGRSRGGKLRSTVQCSTSGATLAFRLATYSICEIIYAALLALKERIRKLGVGMRKFRGPPSFPAAARGEFPSPFFFRHLCFFSLLTPLEVVAVWGPR